MESKKAEAQVWQVAQERKAKGDIHQQQYEKDSRKRLDRIASKKMKTTFIGALSVFEQSEFGSLWGHNKPLSELTDEERKWREIWEEVRTEILNNGNNQLRALQNEISQYKISWNRHTIKSFLSKQEDKDEV